MKFCSECGGGLTDQATGAVRPGLVAGPGVTPAGFPGPTSKSIIAGNQNITHSTVVHNQDETKTVKECAVSGRRAEVTKGHVCPTCGLWVHEDYFDHGTMKCDTCRSALTQRANDTFEAKAKHCLADGVISKEELDELRNLGAGLGLSPAEQDNIIGKLKMDRQAGGQKQLSIIDRMKLKAIVKGIENKIDSKDPVGARTQIQTLRALNKTYPDNSEIATILVSALSGVMISDPESFLPEIQEVLEGPCFAYDTEQKYLVRSIFYRGGLLLGQADVPHNSGNWSDMSEFFNEGLRFATNNIETLFPDAPECHAVQIAMMIDSYYMAGELEEIRTELNQFLEAAVGAAGESDIANTLRMVWTNVKEGRAWGDERATQIGLGSLTKFYFEDLFCMNLKSLRRVLDEGAQGTEETEDSEAESCRKAAEQGDLDAKKRLDAKECERGDAFQNDQNDFQLHQGATDQGDADDQYIRGDNCECEDNLKAREWYQMAAEKGHMGAQYRLGRDYLYGTPEDENLGVYWLKKAAAQGCEDSISILNDISEREAISNANPIINIINNYNWDGQTARLGKVDFEYSHSFTTTTRFKKKTQGGNDIYKRFPFYCRWHCSP